MGLADHDGVALRRRPRQPDQLVEADGPAAKPLDHVHARRRAELPRALRDHAMLHDRPQLHVGGLLEQHSPDLPRAAIGSAAIATPTFTAASCAATSDAVPAAADAASTVAAAANATSAHANSASSNSASTVAAAACAAAAHAAATDPAAAIAAASVSIHALRLWRLPRSRATPTLVATVDVRVHAPDAAVVTDAELLHHAALAALAAVRVLSPDAPRQQRRLHALRG